MRVLALDTSTWQLEAAFVSVARDGSATVLSAMSEPTTRGMHSRLLPGCLESLISSAGFGLADVDGFAAGLGPGSFTGLRTGLSTLKALAYARSRPVAGVSSLASMAFAAAEHLAATEGPEPLLVPLLDARRGQVYAGFYRRRDTAPAAPDAVLGPGALLDRLVGETGPVLLFGSGLDADPRLAGDPRARPDFCTFPSAVAIARLCAPELAAAGPSTALSLQPAYVREQVADTEPDPG